MVKIKIIDKRTKEVVEVKEFKNDREENAFLFWWACNGNQEDYYLERVE